MKVTVYHRTGIAPGPPGATPRLPFYSDYAVGDPMAHVFEYQEGDGCTCTDHDLCERAFFLFNVGHEDPNLDLPDADIVDRYRTQGLRSLSVGDVLRFDRPDVPPTWWACDEMGWHQIDGMGNPVVV